MKTGRVLFFSIILILSFHIAAHSMTLSAGANVWYAWWQPMFGERMLNIQRHIDETDYVFKDFDNNISMLPQFMYGPMVSLKFASGLSFSTVFMYGPHYHSSSISEYTNISDKWIPPLDSYYRLGTSLKIKKFDLDSVLSYDLSQYVKLFIGFKWQGYDYDGMRNQMQNSNTWGITLFTGDMSLMSRSYGSGIGVGFQFNVIGNLYSIFNISGLYLRTTITGRGTQLTVGYNYVIKDSETMKFNVYGLNLNYSLAYYLENLGITLSLGFRYQLLVYFVDDTDVTLNSNMGFSGKTPFYVERGLRNDYNKAMDHFYGITIAAIYSFSI